MHDADRQAALAALKQRLEAFEKLGWERTSSLSMQEYLYRLAAEAVIPLATAQAAADYYNRCRFGREALAEGESAIILELLETAAATARRRDPTESAARRRPRDRRPASRERSAAPAPPPPEPRPSPGDVPSRPAAAEANQRKRRVENGPSRLWTYLAIGLALWTMAVMAGSLWQHERIERILASSRWGRPLLGQLQRDGDESLLRHQMIRDKASVSPRDFFHLAERYQTRGDLAEAMHLYREGIARCPEAAYRDKAKAMNDLALLLLTADDPWYRDPVQAAELASQALALRHEASYLDTLAIAHYLMNDRTQAVYYEDLAIARAKETGEIFPGVRHYLRQRRRFERGEPWPPPDASQLKP